MRRPDLLNIILKATGLLCLVASALVVQAAAPSQRPGQPFTLTPAEKKWLAEHPVIRVAPDPAFAPIEFIDESGRYRGGAADYVALLAERLGVQITPVPVKSWEEALQKVKNGEADILARLAKTPEREKYLSFLRHYLELPAGIITRPSSVGIRQLADLNGKKVAIPSGYVWMEVLAADYPDITLVPVSDLEEALEQVSIGRVDAAVTNLLSADYYILKKGLDLKVAGETGYETRYSLAVRKDWPTLKTILEKVTDSLGENEIQALLDRWLKAGTAIISATGVTVEVDAVTAEFVGKRIAELESDGTLDEKSRSQALVYYREAKAHLESASASASQAATYQSMSRTAASEAEQMRQQLSGERAADLPLDTDASIQDLEKQLVEQLTEVKNLRSSLAAQVEQSAREQARPAKIRKELQQQKQELTHTDQALEAPPPAGESTAVTGGRRTALQARKQAHAAAIRRLEQELLSHAARLDLLRARRDVTTKRLSIAEARLAKLRQLVNQRRASEAEEVRQAMEQARQRALGKHVSVRRVAEQNAGLSAEGSNLVARIRDVTRERELVSHDLKEVKQLYQYAREQLGIAGLSDVLGEALRAQRETLPDVNRHERNVENRERQIGEARLRQLGIDQQRRSLRNITAKIDQLLSVSETGVPPTDPATVGSELRQLLLDQRGLLDKLWESYSEYLKELRELSLSEKRLLDTVKSYGSLLDEELLWLASTQVIGVEWLSGVDDSVLWFISPSRFREVGRILMLESSNQVLATVIVLALFGMLIAIRSKLRQYAQTISGNVGSFAGDHFMLTLQALVIALLYVAPWPLMLYYLSWLPAAADDASAFARGVGAGLHEVAITLLALSFFRHLCQEGGVVDTHFQWSTRVRTLLWKNLGWLMAVILPLLFIVTVTENQPDELQRDALGRLAFVAMSLAQLLFAWRVLHPRQGILGETTATGVATSPRYLRYLVFLLGMGFPLLFVSLTVLGYYYTAVSLEEDVFESIIVIGAGVLLYSLFERWLVVAQRRLTRARVRAGREAMQAAKRAAEDGREAVADVPNILEINLVLMNDQTRRLVALLVGALALGGLWLVWSNVLPAFAFLDEVTLWHSRVVEGDVERLAPVTLGDLGLALLVALLTMAAGRNVSGLLEMGLVEHFHVTPGTLYAIATLSRYAIITIGIIVAFSLIGIGWTQVQWLAAAVGVGLGFGLREIFASFIAGLIILFERPVRVGDVVTLGDISGTVTRIRIRATTITDWDNKESVVPNNILVTRELTNWTLSNDVIRVVVKVGLGRGVDTGLAEQVMLDIAKSNPLVLDDPPPTVLFLGFGPHTLEFEVRVFTREQEQRLTLTHQLHMALERGLREHGIELALPKLDVQMRSDVEETPRSRSGPKPFRA